MSYDKLKYIIKFYLLDFDEIHLEKNQREDEEKEATKEKKRHTKLLQWVRQGH